MKVPKPYQSLIKFDLSKLKVGGKPLSVAMDNWKPARDAAYRNSKDGKEFCTRKELVNADYVINIYRVK